MERKTMTDVSSVSEKKESVLNSIPGLFKSHSFIYSLAFAAYVTWIAPHIQDTAGSVLLDNQTHIGLGIALAIGLFIEPIGFILLSRMRKPINDGLAIFAMIAHMVIMVIILMAMMQAFGLSMDNPPWWIMVLLPLLVLKDIIIFLALFVDEESDISYQNAQKNVGMKVTPRKPKKKLPFIWVLFAEASVLYFSAISFTVFWGTLMSDIEFSDYSRILFGMEILIMAIIFAFIYLSSNAPILLMSEEGEDTPEHQIILSFIVSFVVVSIPMIMTATQGVTVRSFEDAFAAKNASKVYVSDQELSELPQNINDLEELTILRFSNNNIRSFPLSFSKLNTLEELYFGYNAIEALPYDMSNFYRLRVMEGYVNNITFLPPSFTQMYRLENINLSFNNIYLLPDEIDRLTALQVLDVRSNALSTLPDSITQLPELRHLDIGNNYITQLPADLSGWEYLREIELDGNPLPQSEIDRLQAAHPDLDIQDDSEEEYIQ